MSRFRCVDCSREYPEYMEHCDECDGYLEALEQCSVCGGYFGEEDYGQFTLFGQYICNDCIIKQEANNETQTMRLP